MPTTMAHAGRTVVSPAMITAAPPSSSTAPTGPTPASSGRAVTVHGGRRYGGSDQV